MLSIAKLEQFLKSQGFLIKKIFEIENSVIYIEVFNINNADTFLLYIPSKYKINTDYKHSTYTLKYIDLEDVNIFKNLNEKSESTDIENQYDNLDVDLDLGKTHEDFEKSLKDNYDRELEIKDLNKEEIQNLKDIYYQLSRLKLSVKSIKYKLSILYKNYLCSIRRDNSMETFIIRDYRTNDLKAERKIYVTIDLENLYKKISNISYDIKNVKNGIYKILNDNQIKNTKVLNSILEKKNSILLYSNLVYKKKLELETYIKVLEELLLKLNDKEKKLIEKILLINENNKNLNIHNDIQNSHEVYNHEREIDKINLLKQEIIKDMIEIRNKQENMTLEIDKILFDNTVMINMINKNFNKLLEIVL